MSRKHDSMVENNETYPKKPRVGRGFFSVLMLCLIAIGGVAATTLSDNTPSAPLDSAQTTTAATTAMTTTTVKPVAVNPVTTTHKTTTTTATVPATTTTTSSPLFVLPLSNKVLTPFSETPLYNETLDTYRAHTAVDFDGEEGQMVLPLADGTVCSVEKDTLWGGCVTVDHGAGVISIYRGVDTSVAIGDEVTNDTALGTLSSVPCESRLGPHLHLELYKDGQAVDATALFDEQLIFDKP